MALRASLAVQDTPRQDQEEHGQRITGLAGSCSAGRLGRQSPPPPAPSTDRLWEWETVHRENHQGMARKSLDNNQTLAGSLKKGRFRNSILVLIQPQYYFFFPSWPLFFSMLLLNSRRGKERVQKSARKEGVALMRRSRAAVACPCQQHEKKNGQDQPTHTYTMTYSLVESTQHSITAGARKQ